jgi:N-methylhydantoinase B
MHLDFDGTTEQARGPINSSYAQSLTAVTYAVRALVGRAAPLNEGLWRSYTVNLPMGTVICPAHPAACNTRMSGPTPSIVEAILWALSGVAPNGIGIAASGVPDVHAINPRAKDEYWLHFEAEWGGAGARSSKDGVDSGGTPMLGSGGGMIPVETQEAMYDYLCERYTLRQDTGGPGRFRGGLGITKDYRFLRPCYVSARTDRWKFPPIGVEGGKAGLPGEFLLNPGKPGERRLHSKFSELMVDDGDVVSLRTMGGGGYGDPLTRDIERVLDDVRRGHVSRACARSEYGVVIVDGAERPEIDRDATRVLREGTS